MPNEMTWEEAAYIESLACAIHEMERANVEKAASAAIIGAGPMGLALGYCVIVSGTSRVRCPSIF